ncbi:CHAT domain-containing protein [Pseudoalteromonas prydzensis]|uniref:CHAT domain-containing protein n=1 Tax=Pseudoalteromonas prydzensis TaxID=182141 RepID=A0ABR9FSD0_9GAMM|nr:CHAT domain-containing protein [Pseudoalteromonas prydzensis]MBE0459734.1 hypothetical protein [Pseudoalteromonas prydzensis]
MLLHFKEIFPEFTEKTPIFFVDLKGEILDKIFVRDCIEYIYDMQYQIFHDLGSEKTIELSRIAIADLINLKNTPDINKEILIVINYLQLCLTFYPLSDLVITGQHNSALKWINYSMCDDLSDKQVIKLELIRFDEFFNSDTVRSVMSPKELTQWFGNFYYTCRKLSAYHNVAEELVIFCRGVSNVALKYKQYEEFTWAFSCLIAWAISVKHGVSSELVKEVEALISDINMPDEAKAQLILCLITDADIYSEKSIEEWASLLISTYPGHLRGHQKLQTLVAMLPTNGSENIVRITEKIKSEICSLKKDLYERIKLKKPSIQLIEQDRLFEMISPIFDRLLTAQKVTLLYEVLFDWYQIPQVDSIVAERTLIIYPKSKTGLKIGLNNETVTFKRDISSTYASLIKASNQFLGVSHSINGIHDFEFWDHLPERMGVPTQGFSDELYGHLVDFYGFEIKELNAFIKSHANSIESYICLPSMHFPVQFLMQKSLETCWPLSISLEKAKLDKPVSKVCLWCGAGSLTEQIESETLTKILKANGIEVTLFKSDKTTKNGFINIYQDNQFDVIWVMSHGEFDHWKPGEISIEIGNKEFLSLDEAMKLSVPDDHNRRLLFLNICDGATHSSTEGLERLGFAPALASSLQCVISHLWPITSWSAVTFGVIYSSYLTTEGDFFSAFRATLRVMANGNNAVHERLAELSNHSEELRDRLKHQDNNFDLMAHSGSSVFFQ